MLVLTRKRGEKILIPKYGGTFVVLRVKGDAVRIGIEAPGDAAIYREEVAPGGEKRDPNSNDASQQ